MSYSTTTNKNLREVDPGTEIGTWGPILNTDWIYLDAALGSAVSYTLNASSTTQTVGTSGTSTTPPDYVNQRIILTGNTGSSYVFSGTGTISGTVLTITGVTGAISVGNVISGTGVSAGTTIVNQLTGTTGGNGTYTVSLSQVVASTTINGNNGQINLVFPSSISGMWIVNNATTGPASVYAVTASSGSGVYLNQGVNSLIYSDGTNIAFADNRIQSQNGATGGGSDAVFYLNNQVITISYTIPSTSNAMTAGPVTINSGITVTINSPSVWTIV
jgi:hypothetical protein